MSREQDQDEVVEQLINTRLIRLNAIIQGVVFGLLAGSILFVATIWLVIKGGPVVGPNLSLLGQFFVGYSVSYLGSVVGFFYAFVVGFLGGYSTAHLYNWILDFRTGG
jgi:hypothetical protein